jgi:predicted transcriptional regulator
MSTTPAARFTFLLDPELKQQFEQCCAAEDITPSQMMRQMIKAYISQRKTTALVNKKAKTRRQDK